MEVMVRGVGCLVDGATCFSSWSIVSPGQWAPCGVRFLCSVSLPGHFNLMLV
jgi:hypothetical protein